MKLSEQLKQDHECGDFGNAIEGYWQKAKELEDRIDELIAEFRSNFILDRNETIPYPPKMPTPPPIRIYRDTFLGGLIETEASKKATKEWSENKC